VAEVKFQTNLYAAERDARAAGHQRHHEIGDEPAVGRAPLSTAAGRFDSRTYFATVRSGSKADQFGGSFGGPLRKTRRSFCRLRGIPLKEGQPNLITVPTPAMLRGDFRRCCRTRSSTTDDDAAHAISRATSFRRTASARFARQLCGVVPNADDCRPRQQLFKSDMRTQDSNSVTSRSTTTSRRTIPRSFATRTTA
jgi:hypothetical protein